MCRWCLMIRHIPASTGIETSVSALLVAFTAPLSVQKGNSGEQRQKPRCKGLVRALIYWIGAEAKMQAAQARESFWRKLGQDYSRESFAKAKPEVLFTPRKRARKRLHVTQRARNVWSRKHCESNCESKSIV